MVGFLIGSLVVAMMLGSALGDYEKPSAWVDGGMIKHEKTIYVLRVAEVVEVKK